MNDKPVPYYGAPSRGAPVSAPTDEDTRSMYLTIVCDVTKEDGPQVYANVCAVVEDCMTIESAEWSAQEGTSCAAVFQGHALVPLSQCMARLHTDTNTRDRVRKIDYRKSRQQGAMQHPTGKR